MHLPPLMPYQERGVAQTIAHLDEGKRFVMRALFTGGGKTREAIELSKWAISYGKRVVFYVNQRDLTTQSGANFAKAGMVPSYRAAGFDEELGDVMIASVQTVRTRHSSKRKKQTAPPVADLVIVDEAHRKDFDPICDYYRNLGAAIIGYSATPVDLWDGWEVMVTAGTKREGRRLGRIVPFDTYHPFEIDFSDLNVNAEGEVVAKAADQRVATAAPEIVGDIAAHWRRCNPLALPTVCWCPGLSSARGVVHYLLANGIKAEAVDGSMDRKEREAIYARHESGATKILCTVGMLREGTDMPYLKCGILLQPCRLLKTYEQAVGRLARACDRPGCERAILIDHSGATHLHGRPDTERFWQLGMFSRAMLRERKDRLASMICNVCGLMLKGTDRRCTRCEAARECEPVYCEKCHYARDGGTKCPICGFQPPPEPKKDWRLFPKSVRFLRAKDGELTRIVGDFIPHKDPMKEAAKIWKQTLFSAGHRGMKISQALAMFSRNFEGLDLPPGIFPDPLATAKSKGIGYATFFEMKVEDVWPWTVRKKKGPVAYEQATIYREMPYE